MSEARPGTGGAEGPSGAGASATGAPGMRPGAAGAGAAGAGVGAGAEAPVTLAITGASGAVYGVRLLEALNDASVPVRLIISSTGWRLLDEELSIADEAALRVRTGDWSRVVVYRNDDRGATPASGSAPSRGMAICPCSMGTLASIAQGTTRSLIERAADVCLKERRRLVVVPRETPLSAIHLENMLRLTRAGAVVLPAAPGFYHRPSRVDELVDFIVARVLGQLGVPTSLGPHWQSGEPDA